MRVVVAAACALCVWLITTPAQAAAPQCDTRGATTFAPAPTLQAPMTSIDVGDAAPECESAWLADLLEQRSSSPDQGQEVAQTVLSGASLKFTAPSTRTNGLELPEGHPLTGVRFPLDRPPRQ
ncbi:MAG: hypothetical protein ABIP39_14915 [Polyangiaceae bacterium]